MKAKQEINIKFDMERIKRHLIQENKYIINVWRKTGQQFNDPQENGDSAAVKNKPGRLFGVGSTRARTIEELYSKLDEIKGKKLQYKERLLKKGLKNKVGKKKRKEERKMKKKMGKLNKQTLNLKTEDVKSTPAKPAKPAKPVFNSEGKVVFSKFDFTGSGNDVQKRKDKQPKDPHKLIKKLEKQKEKFEHLEEKGEFDRISELKEKQMWKTVLQRAEGLKVKDHLGLLKQSVKRQQKQKLQSKKKWKQRDIEVQKQIDKKQETRQANIDERKKKKRVKHIKRLVKRGRIIPGF